MKKQYHLTIHGRRELEEELAQLIESRAEIASKISEARDYGDLSENAEYSAAREEQSRVETRVIEIEHILQNADIIRESKSKKGIVKLGVAVTLQNGKKTVDYKIVGPVEADPMDGKISNESPLGAQLIGKKIGERAVIDTPKGKKTYEIVGIDG
ncbi:MAG: transcription elongation factor GreA [Candidatus Nomurabacteria bacterium]|jgi:transcription elongation factor GreA|nr:transcription elongation factor GreA [Candidatus Nomurabacteria bacterium]